MIIRTLGVLPDTLLSRLQKAGFSLIPVDDNPSDNRHADKPVLVGTGADMKSVRNDEQVPALRIGLADNPARFSGEDDCGIDLWVNGSDPDRLVFTLKKLVGTGLSRHVEGNRNVAWILVRGNGTVASASPTLARKLKQLGSGASPFKLGTEQMERLMRGEKIPLGTDGTAAGSMTATAAHTAGSVQEHLLTVESAGTESGSGLVERHPLLENLPGVMLSGSMESCVEGLVDTVSGLLVDRPVAVMVGPELKTHAVRDIDPERAKDLAELLCNFNVRSILHEHALPLSGEQVLVIPPAVALRLGSYPVESTDGMMPNLLVVQLRDPGDRLAGMIVAEIPHDRLPDPDQVRVLQILARFAAVAVRWQEVIGVSADSVSLLESLIENDPSGVAVLDDAGRIRKVNRSLQKLTGYRREELVGRTLNRVFMPDQVARIQDFRTQSSVGSFETEIPAASGDTRPVRVLVYPFRQHGTRHHVIQLEDLADNWALRQKELEVERLQAVFGAAVAFHDKINTPLSIILAHQERLKYKWKAGLNWEDLEKSLSAVEHQVDKITEIIERMRDMKRYRVREYALRDVSMVDLSDSTEVESTET